MGYLLGLSVQKRFSVAMMPALNLRGFCFDTDSVAINYR